MSMTITKKQQKDIAKYFDGRKIAKGLGSKESACSIAGINLALFGRLTDDIPDCMSIVIGRWIIGVQDAMPDEMRNSDEWRKLLPLAAGTGRDHEAERLAIILDWLWEVTLPSIQPVADKYGFGTEWLKMTTERTSSAADSARSAAYSAADSAADSARSAADSAAYSARSAAYSAARSAAYSAADSAADSARSAAYSAAYSAADSAAYSAADSARSAAWKTFNPVALLTKLIEVSA